MISCSAAHAIASLNVRTPVLHVLTRPAARRRRGGGEYGLDWWEGGRLHKKQNGFDDFASCAQFLHSAGYSSPAKLTIEARPAGQPALERGLRRLCNLARGCPRAWPVSDTLSGTRAGTGPRYWPTA